MRVGRIKAPLRISLREPERYLAERGHERVARGAKVIRSIQAYSNSLEQPDLRTLKGRRKRLDPLKKSPTPAMIREICRISARVCTHCGLLITSNSQEFATHVRWCPARGGLKERAARQTQAMRDRLKYLDAGFRRKLQEARRAGSPWSQAAEACAQENIEAGKIAEKTGVQVAENLIQSFRSAEPE